MQLFSSLPTWTYPAALGFVLVVGGIGQYFGLLPVGTFGYVFVAVVALLVPSPAFPTTHISAPQAQVTIPDATKVTITPPAKSG